MEPDPPRTATACLPCLPPLPSHPLTLTLSPSHTPTHPHTHTHSSKLQSANVLYPVVVRFDKPNYAGVSTNNYALDEVKEV